MLRAVMQSLQPRQDQTLEPSSRWRLIRDVVVFQTKLALDGLRDLVMSPLSLVAGLVGLLGNNAEPRRLFDDVLRAGKRFDEWVNLFEPVEDDLPEDRARVDSYFHAIEDILAQQHARGGMTRAAKERIDGLLDAIQRRKPAPPSNSESGSSRE